MNSTIKQNSIFASQAVSVHSVPNKEGRGVDKKPLTWEDDRICEYQIKQYIHSFIITLTFFKYTYNYIPSLHFLLSMQSIVVARCRTINFCFTMSFPKSFYFIFLNIKNSFVYFSVLFLFC